MGFISVMLFPLGLLMAGPLQCWLYAFSLHPWRHRDQKLKVTLSCTQVLLPWRDAIVFTQGVPQGMFQVDASIHRRLLGRLGSSLRVSGGEGCMRIPVGHISVLELRATHLQLKVFFAFIQGKHVLVRTDNCSAVHNVNHQGGTRHCLKATQGLFFWVFLHISSLRASCQGLGPPPGE